MSVEWQIYVARGEAECYICHKTLIKSCVLSYKQSGSVKCFIVFYTNLTHFLNKQTGFFVEMYQQNHSSITTLAFYNYPTTVL